jgi:signal transduction histidine kinase
MASVPERTGIGWHSLSRRLTLLVSLLLLVVVAAISGIAHFGLRQALIESGSAHAQRVAAQIADGLARRVLQSQDGARAAASLPQIAALASGAGDPATGVAFLRRVAADNPAFLGAGVRAADGGWIAWADGPAADSIPTPARELPADPRPQEGVSPIRPAGESLYYDAVARIAGPTEAWMVLRTRIADQANRRIFRNLVGAGAVLLLGSSEPDGTWSDLAEVTAAPVAETGSRYGWQGETYSGTMLPVGDSRWRLWVGLSHDELLTPSAVLARRMAWIGALVLLLGAAGAYLLGRHFTRPISRLEHGLAALQAGHYHARVPQERRDELGRLAAGFNRMAAEIESATANLEATVANRTQELAQALNDLASAQEQLVRREKLAMLGQLASSVGHELRNPLGVMTNAVYYLEMISPDRAGKTGEYLGILRTQLGLAEKIVSDLLDFARVKTPERTPVALDRLLEDQLRRVGGLNGIAIERSYDPAAPPAAIDAVQIGQVMFNLLTNAVQAMVGQADHGRLLLATRRAAADRVAFEVGDSGSGIAAEDRERIFEPLFTTKARGIGLGLSVSRTLVEANGGAIEVDSVPGDGATFTVTLPAANGVE